MTTHTYRAIFEIGDTERPISALIAEACGALDVMAANDGARITGQPVWTVAGERLVCEVAAEPLPEQTADTPAEARAKRDADLLRLAGLRWSLGQIAAVTGVPATTVRSVLARHGTRTAYAPGGHLRDELAPAA